MMRTKELKSIGTVLASEISLTDTSLGLYIPIETESDIIKSEREKFESWIVRDVQKQCPDVNLDECTLHTEIDLYINVNGINEYGKYELTFFIGFISWLTDADGNEIYDDMSDGFAIELPDDDKSYIKRIVAEKIADALM